MASMTDKAEPLQLPSEAELCAAIKAILDASEATIKVSHKVGRIERFATDTPTPEQVRLFVAPLDYGSVGRLFAWLTDARGALQELTSYVENVGRGLDDVEYVRELRSGDDA
jgi:hypothetical protein